MARNGKGNSGTLVDDRAIELLVLAAEDGDDIWESAVSIGITLTSDEDSIIWKSAKLAAAVKVKYGQASLSKFANEIHKSTKTIRERNQVWSYFGEGVIKVWREYPILMYTHFRLAMRLGEKHESYPQAITFLQDCVEGDWSVSKAEIEQARRMGKTIQPRKIGELEAAILDVETDAEAVTLQIHDKELLAEFALMLKENRPLTLKLFAVEVEPPPAEDEPEFEPEAEPELEGLSAL